MVHEDLEGAESGLHTSKGGVELERGAEEALSQSLFYVSVSAVLEDALIHGDSKLEPLRGASHEAILAEEERKLRENVVEEEVVGRELFWERVHMERAASRCTP